MMRKIVLLSLVLTLLGQVPGLVADANAGVRLGGGVHYLRYLGEIKETEKFDDDALGFMASLLFAGPVLKLDCRASPFRWPAWHRRPGFAISKEVIPAVFRTCGQRRQG